MDIPGAGGLREGPVLSRFAPIQLKTRAFILRPSRVYPRSRVNWHDDRDRRRLSEEKVVKSDRIRDEVDMP